MRGVHSLKRLWIESRSSRLKINNFIFFSPPNHCSLSQKRTRRLVFNVPVPLRTRDDYVKIVCLRVIQIRVRIKARASPTSPAHPITSSAPACPDTPAVGAKRRCPDAPAEAAAEEEEEEEGPRIIRAKMVAAAES